uniref:Serine/threonine-protein kinase Nek11 n=1 Tax=Ornithorhynchus anatinus TaxID=9258 RepID=F6Y676_ORNAN
MLKFQETAKYMNASKSTSTYSKTLIARRYALQQKLGSGSFGTVYLVSDKKAKQGEELKVLKEISIGELKPNETVQANMEALLLSKLDHPSIVKFYTSFVERDNFCIITEYCEGRDLDCKIQEYREAGKTFPESQILEWFIQLLLGVNYMHERRILHRDLKAKNMFLKNNLLKIGDFGVSRLLMGSCDLATTFTGTPYYMSPEALKHQGYDTKSDIWSLACILYEMCCINHAFTGHSFLSIVYKIVEGETPSLPGRYPRELNEIMQSMLNKNPSSRPSAREILKSPYIDAQLQHMKCKYSHMVPEDKRLNCQKETDHIVSAVQKKVHLQTLRDFSEVQKMTPRERMRLRKLQAADEKVKKLQKLAEEKYQENSTRMQELRSRHFEQPSLDVLHVRVLLLFHSAIYPPQLGSSLITSYGFIPEIPEDPLVAEEYYDDVFDSCSEESEEEAEEKIQEEMVEYETSQTVVKTNQQVSAVFRNYTCSLTAKFLLFYFFLIYRSAIQKLGAEVFEKVYGYLKGARQQTTSEDEIRESLEKLVPRASDCFEVDQLLYFEELLLAGGEDPVMQSLL